MFRQIILASASKQRLAIFKTFGLAFKVIASNIDESVIIEDDPVKRAEKIARAKAEAVATKHPESIVIAADTYGYLNGESLEKPQSKAEAKTMLKKLSNQEFTALTGFCYLDYKNKIDYSICKKIQAKFRVVSQKQIDKYVAKQAVTTWSAAFSPAYPVGASFIAEMQGSFNAFTYGLPLEELPMLFKKSGIDF